MNKDKRTKTRISVTLTRPYVEALDLLVEEGVYLGKGEIVLEALRSFFRERGMELPYYKEV